MNGEIFHILLSVPQSIVMDMNNVVIVMTLYILASKHLFHKEGGFFWGGGVG